MSTFIKYPAVGGVPTYASYAALPATAADGALAVTLDTDFLYVYNVGSGLWTAIAGPGDALSVGTIDTGTPNANGAQISNTGALILQTATASVPGYVSLTTQTFAGNKTFSGTISASNLSGTNTGDVTIGTANGLSLSAQILSLGTSSGSTTGALTSTDWTTFNSKQAAGNYITALTGDATASGPGSAALTLATVNGSPGSFGSASTSLSATVNGKGLITALSSQSIQIAESQVTNLVSDLAGKQATLTIGDLTDAGTDGIIVTGGTGSIIGTGVSLSQHVADTTHNGYLSSTDWNTFNGKQASGNYITALTGDATASGPGSAALTLATVNSNVGSFGSASSVTTLTVNAKGLITAAASTSIQIAESQVTGLVADLAAKQAGPLTGDVTSSGAATTVAKIQGVTVTGATGSGNVVLSASPTLTGTISANAATFANAISASNLSGTNTGDVTLAAVGATPNANGASISSQVLTLQPASGTLPGVLTAGTQTIGGAKTFSGAISASNLSGTNTGDQTITLTGDVTGTGTGSFATTLAATSNATLTTLSSLVSVGTITTGTWSATAIAVNKGGTGQTTANAGFNALSPMTTGGDLIYGGASGVATRLANGTNGQVLTSSGGTSAPTWTSVGTGTVTSVSVVSANGLAGTVATATTTPAITLSTSITGILQGNGTAISAASTTGSGNVVLSASPTFTGTLTAATITPTGITGSNGTSSASTGNVGEYVESIISTNTSVPGANGAYGDLTSISLTAGDWDISMLVELNNNGAVATTVEYGISTTSGNSGTGLVVGSNDFDMPWLATAAVNQSVVLPCYRVLITSTTTVYAKLNVGYSSGTPRYRCRLSARRMR